ncbi:hypothetical protein [Phenylobacterium sp.]|uniref:hypothetical protein n=1 Tax=Phenylobacterium sp. TaxID=1871053 RepID=UPI0019A5814D|nr:hypothetical protein [Phenylobacterium sp.]MBC7169148.1 hypothetical protein [Phenylobacterium sp.]
MKYVSTIAVLAAGLMLSTGVAEARQGAAPQQGQTAGGAANESPDAVGGKASASANRTDDGKETRSTLLNRGWAALKNYDGGRLGARATTVQDLKAARQGRPPKSKAEAPVATLPEEKLAMAAVEDMASELSRSYARRSGRMQTNLDVSSGAVTLGGSGYLLSAGAGAATQAMWGYGALVPVLVAQFNARHRSANLVA